MQPRWIFHVGYPKCASTSLQNILPRSERILYAGKHRANYLGTDGRTIVRRLLAATARNALPVGLIRAWQDEVEAIARDRGLSTIVLSDEVLSRLNANRSPFEIVSAMSSIFGQSAEFCFVIREHWSLMRSNYRQKLKVGMPFDFKHFCLNTAHGVVSPFLQNTHYHRIFGRLRAQGIAFRVFLFERLISEPEYVRVALDHFDADDMPAELPRMNKSPDDHSLEQLRRDNLQAATGRLASFSATNELLTNFEIDRKHLEGFARTMGVESSTYELWNREIQAAEAIRRARLKDLEPGPDPIDWTVSPKLKATLDRAFRASCRDLDALTGEDCGAYGYAV